MNRTSTMGSRIKEMRLQKGMTQEQLAELLYTKKVTISAYENDRIDIKSSVVVELARLLDCTVSYLMEGTKPATDCEELIRIFQGIENESARKLALEQLKLFAKFPLE